jgi:hypothetical protein
MSAAKRDPDVTRFLTNRLAEEMTRSQAIADLFDRTAEKREFQDYMHDCVMALMDEFGRETYRCAERGERYRNVYGMTSDE